jgi:hypothetical protein
VSDFGCWRSGSESGWVHGRGLGKGMELRGLPEEAGLAASWPGGEPDGLVGSGKGGA